MEISQANIKDCPVETKTKLAEDLFRLLQVREKNSEMVKDWLLFLNGSSFNKLTPGEIYIAFKMAMSRELLDSKGKEIELLPELSNNTTGKVLSAYLKYKHEDAVYQNAKDKLRQHALPSFQEPSDEQKKAIREKFLEFIFIELTDHRQFGYPSDAWMLYEDIEHKIVLADEVKERLYRMQEKKYYKELDAEARSKKEHVKFAQTLQDFLKNKKSGKRNGVVQNRCKSIVVCNYLKKYLTDYETFKNAIIK
ncbi:hypothetical protein [Flavobacterium coralii]|uniref:hypothetical protein n=1 Tax=Flavobacterium coralii TaxID=2838017 RepID=UPI000C659756|nr:hypothetical protein [Flavobacterium sp.]|tara:strand:- start:31044 stop:31796 length:753 start_codon:yes stop_codon:yes gene_type:complete